MLTFFGDKNLILRQSIGAQKSMWLAFLKLDLNLTLLLSRSNIWLIKELWLNFE